MKSLFPVFMVLLFPLLLSGSVDTMIVTGVNGRLNAIEAPEQMMVVKSKGSQNIKVEYFVMDDGKWVKTNTERAREFAPERFRITSGRGRTKTTMIRDYVEMADGRWQFVESIQKQVVRRGTSILRFPILPDGVLVTHYPNGPVKTEETYRNNELISNINWLENGLPYVEDLFYSVDRYPAYSRGNEQINKQIMAKFKEKQVDFSSISGKLEIGFVVFENGKVGAFRILKSIDPDLDNMIVEAIRSLEGEWIPARLNNQTVRFFQTFPIHFNHYEMQVEFFDYYSGLVQFERK
ncbi:MAG: energy transducer TonB [Prolixibacteraceae bacterium]|nr:energy transducer TonB [Prolixibacteraceae bacterium]